jgi:hypothetical protein
MLPPSFIKHLEGGGKDPPHCKVCAQADDFERELVCMEYGAYVLLYSSCGSFESREKGTPVIGREEVSQKYASGLIDMRGGKK